MVPFDEMVAPADWWTESDYAAFKENAESYRPSRMDKNLTAQRLMGN